MKLTVQATLLPDAEQPFDDRCLSWQPDQGTVSIWTTAGGIVSIATTAGGAA